MTRTPATGSSAQARGFLRWIGSLLGVMGFVVGIPAVLIAFHATPPFAHLGHALAHPGHIGNVLGSSLSDSAVAGTVTCVAWVAWLWFALCVAFEMVGALRGRPTLHLPGSRHVQSLAAALVGASLAFVPIGSDAMPMRLLTAPVTIIDHPRNGHGAPGADSVVLTLSSFESLRSQPGAGVGVVAAGDEVATSTPGEIYVVRPGDTLWSIAEHELGSPLRWPEIAELNYGRPQSEDGSLSDAHWIFPGWRLVLPASPTVGKSADVVERTTVPITNGSDPGAQWPNASSWARPGSSSRAPSEEAIRTAASAVGGKVNGAKVNGAKVNGRRPETTESDKDKHLRSPLPAGVIGYGLLGAGVIGLLERMRRVQRRHRPAGLRIALPDGDLAELERRLRVEADPGGVEIIDLGLRILVAHSLRAELMPPRVTVVRLGDHTLEVVLDPASVGGQPPPPVISDLVGSRWLLPIDQTTMQELREESEVARTDAPYPALVTVGRDQFGLVLVDVEQAASVGVSGTNVVGILGAMAAEMATATWADQVEVILVGVDAELQELEGLERVSHVPTIADILSKVQRRVRERGALLASVDRRANWEIRWTEGGDAWDLLIVICGPSAVDAEPDGAAALVRLAGGGGLGLAVVLGRDVGVVRWHLAAHDGRISVESTGISASAFRPEQTDSSLVTGIASLVKVAENLEGVLPGHPPYVEGLTQPPERYEPPDRRVQESQSASEPIETRTTDERVDVSQDVVMEDLEIKEAPEIDVRVLGPVEIFGAARPFTRAWSVELVVYLALHRRGAASEQWATALWPDRIMAAASLHSTASAARRSLGVSLSGEDHLPRAHGRLALAPSVDSDWNRFVELAAQDEPESWRRALELIRGRPFEGLRAPDWVLLEGIAANVEAVVVDLAGRFAENCLSVGHASGAEWAARQGLRVSAYDERLYRILLRAADAAGNPAGVETVMNELVRLVAEDVEPYDAVHPETLELYRSLSRRPAPTVHR